MKYLHLCHRPATLLSVVLLSIVGIVTAAPEPQVLAVVNGISLTQADYEMYVAQRLGDNTSAAAEAQTLTEEEQKAHLNDMINFELLVQEAEKKGLDKKIVKDPNLAPEKRRVILASALINQYVEDHPPTEQELQKEFETHRAALDKDYLARHILTRTAQDARSIIAELDKGADFAELAKTKSLDTINALSGGEWGWLPAYQITLPLADALATLKPGTYTKIPVQTPSGWHVVKLEETRKVAVPATFHKIRVKLKEMLSARKVKDYLEQLRKVATIELKAQPVASSSPQARLIVSPYNLFFSI